jgi:hypothetical protein
MLANKQRNGKMSKGPDSEDSSDDETPIAELPKQQANKEKEPKNASSDEDDKPLSLSLTHKKRAADSLLERPFMKARKVDNGSKPPPKSKAQGGTNKAKKFDHMAQFSGPDYEKAKERLNKMLDKRGITADVRARAKSDMEMEG